jgi:hypothetical protein
MARLQQCHCGSGEFPSAQYDGHGIFMTYTCDKCEKEKLSHFRADIFERYECDEPIDSEGEQR